MAHLDDITARVDATIHENSIEHMNELLIQLSDDAELNREERYEQQQRLRNAIAHKGHHQREEMQERHDALTKGGTII